MRYRHPKSHYYLGILFLKRNLFEESIREFKTSLEQDHSFNRAFIGLGVSYEIPEICNRQRNVFKTALNMAKKFPGFLNYYRLAHLFGRI